MSGVRGSGFGVRGLGSGFGVRGRGRGRGIGSGWGSGFGFEEFRVRCLGSGSASRTIATKDKAIRRGKAGRAPRTPSPAVASRRPRLSRRPRPFTATPQLTPSPPFARRPRSPFTPLAASRVAVVRRCDGTSATSSARPFTCCHAFHAFQRVFGGRPRLFTGCRAFSRVAAFHALPRLLARCHGLLHALPRLLTRCGAFTLPALPFHAFPRLATHFHAVAHALPPRLHATSGDYHAFRRCRAFSALPPLGTALPRLHAYSVSTPLPRLRRVATNPS